MRSTKKVTRLAIVVLAAVFTPMLSGCLSLLFSGGVGNIYRNLKPAPEAEGRTLTRKRERATRDAEAALAFVDTAPGLTSYATSTDDRCYKGENDWKITDGFAHRCTVRTTRFYGTSGDFKSQLLGLEDLLASGGWQMPRSTFRSMFATYYDRYCPTPHIALFGVGVGQPSCEVSRLPRTGSEGYRKGRIGLWIECAERGQDNFSMMDVMQKGPNVGRSSFFQKTKLQDVNVQVQDITATHRYVISVTVEETYFEN